MVVSVLFVMLQDATCGTRLFHTTSANGQTLPDTGTCLLLLTILVESINNRVQTNKPMSRVIRFLMKIHTDNLKPSSILPKDLRHSEVSSRLVVRKPRANDDALTMASEHT